jgi:hypothetical protein
MRVFGCDKVRQRSRFGLTPSSCPEGPTNTIARLDDIVVQKLQFSNSVPRQFDCHWSADGTEANHGDRFFC